MHYIDSHAFMNRSPFQRVNSHWVRACFNEDEWAGTLKEAKITGVWFHEVHKHFPLRNEYEANNEARLRRESGVRTTPLKDCPQWYLDFRAEIRRKIREPLVNKINLNMVKSAVAKYATIPVPSPWDDDPPSPPRTPTKRLEPVEWAYDRPSHPVIEAVSEPKLVTETKALINKEYEVMMSNAMTRQEIIDAWEWQHRMYDAVDVLIKTGRVHEFTASKGDKEC